MTFIKERDLPWIIFFSVLLVYLGFLTKNYYWDGIYFAQLIESAGSLDATLIHPNHPFYNPFGYVFYRLVQLSGVEARAVTVLQVVNCMLSASAAAVLFFVLRRCFRSVYLSVVLTFLFAFSATWWKFSTDADSYIASILFLLVSFYLILPDGRPMPFAVALTHTISMSFHQLAVFFFPVVIAGIYFQTSELTRQERFRKIAEYAVTSFIATFGIYYLSFYLQAGTLYFGELVSWLTHFSPENGFVFSIKESLTHTFRGELKLFFEGRFNFIKEIINPFTVLLSAVLAAAFVGLAVQIYGLWRDRKSELLPKATGFRQLTLLCLIWAGSYLIFLFFWIPKNTFYRMFYMPAFIILIGVLLARYRVPEKRKWLMPLFVTVMTVSNFLFFIYPYSRVRKGTPLELSLGMNNVWSRNSVIYYSIMESDNKMIRYFNPTTTWKPLVEMSVQELENEIGDVYANGGDAWIETSALEQLSRDQSNAEWLKDHTDENAEFKLDDKAYKVTLIKILP